MVLNLIPPFECYIIVEREVGEGGGHLYTEKQYMSFLLNDIIPKMEKIYKRKKRKVTL